MNCSLLMALLCAALVGSMPLQGARASRLLLAPAPSPDGEATADAESLFIIEAAMATFTRNASGSNNGTLLLRSVDPASSFFSETPTLMAGKISSKDLSGPKFFKDDDSDAWLNNANLAMYAPKSNGTTQSTNVFHLNSAPVVTEGGSVWAMNVTYIPSTVKSVYSVAGTSSFVQNGGPLVTDYSPVVLFVDAICYRYNRYTGYIYYWFYC